MPWSPSRANSLPSLRPGQSSPPAALKGRPTALRISRVQSSNRESYGFQLKHTVETQSSSNHTSTGIKDPYFPWSTSTVTQQEAPTSDEPDAARPSKAPRLQSRSSRDGFGRLPSSARHGKATSASAPAATSLPFFSLTEQELKQLRRTMGKGTRYANFRHTTIARSLDHLGRGWNGYLRAKDKAEHDGTSDEFWRNFNPELNTILSITQSPPLGALSLETAAIAAQSNYINSVGVPRPESAAEIQRLRVKSRSSLPDAGLGGPELSSCESAVVQSPSCSALVLEADSHQQKSPEPVLSSRPKRVLQRPNYRIPPLLESSPEPPSSPEMPPKTPSPTPRELYDRTQPTFVQYPCEWKRCKASLNNLETLHKHIRIVHVEEATGTLCCQWGICGTSTLTMYESPEDFNHHFTTAHLEPLKWRLGDGQKCRGVVAKAPSV